jgi:hypothetical protein
VIKALPAHAGTSQAAKLIINKRDKLVRSALVTGVKSVEE